MSIAKAGFIETPVKQTKGLSKSVSRRAYHAAVESHSDIHTLWIIGYKRRVGILLTLVVIMGVQKLVPSFFAIMGDLVQSFFGL